MDQPKCGADLLFTQAEVLGELNFRIQPELCFPCCGLYVHVNSEIEPVRAVPEDRGTHAWILTGRAG